LQDSCMYACFLCSPVGKASKTSSLFKKYKLQ
jgi:hypothetical protein